jgi:uncharacterized protein YydD (DUF2326 family)
MIHSIYSSLSSFKTLTLKPGLNVLLAKKEDGASHKQTRNRAGKTSLIEVVHFLMGADVDKHSLFRLPALINNTFSIEFDLDGEHFFVERSGQQASKINYKASGFSDKSRLLTKSSWKELLGEKMFGLHQIPKVDGRIPTFRSLFSYFARRQSSEAFTTPEKVATKQQAVDYQVALLFLLGLDWKIASDWQKVRDREKTLTELKKAANIGTFGSIVGKASDLRTQLMVEDARLMELKAQVANFRVLPQYAELEVEADQLTRTINELANGNIIDLASIADIECAIQAETPPALTDLESIYSEAGIALPGLALKRYDEVRSFHESVIRNRRDYLTGELDAAKQRVGEREQTKARLDERRAAVMMLLRNHGALEHFSQMQGEAARMESVVESLRQRFEAAEKLEGTKNELEIERNRLTLRLRRDFSEQKERLSAAILAFEKTSRQLYESAGSMTVDVTSNGPEFQFPMQGYRSKGIKNIQIFCFDMMLMRLCASQRKGPGFLIHDSHIFDGVDGRQLISALKVGAETAEDLGFQYIVTMNEDDAFKETIADFNLSNYVLDTVLTDATEDGGLFGFRF